MQTETKTPEGDDDEGPINGRMCIVTRETGDPDDLIRFVAGPDGRVVPDLKRKLPGRGCWVKAERAVLEKAIARKLLTIAFQILRDQRVYEQRDVNGESTSTISRLS